MPYNNLNNLIRRTPKLVMARIRLLAALESAATGNRVTQQSLVNRILGGIDLLRIRAAQETVASGHKVTQQGLFIRLLTEYVEAHKVNCDGCMLATCINFNREVKYT